ncbi:DUF1700 domain-containing protein [Clostridium sp. ATCC 25772]|uniref:DUF1700 domain-containing protein n=1 Tax=Clostridium sp. ATCC 25772 TaxID=1676991 RepID=UPI0007851285|nr:DUF1700 domain-containing protein [Clostridium sp. ATCC 25772]
MSKDEFLAQLRNGLKELDKYTLEDILKDYEEYFIHGREEDKTEDTICKELGTPEQIIENLCEQGIINKNHLIASNKNKITYSSLNIIILVILNLILVSILFPIVSGIIGVAISMVISLPFVTVGTIGLIFTTIINKLTIFPLFCLLTILSAMILILIGIYFLTYGFIILSKKYINWNKKFARGE